MSYFLKLLVLFLAAILVVIATCGCNPQPRKPGIYEPADLPPAEKPSEAAARTRDRANDTRDAINQAYQAADKIEPSNVNEQKPVLMTKIGNAGRAATATADAAEESITTSKRAEDAESQLRGQLAKAEGAIKERDKAIEQHETKAAKMDGKWYVRAGRFVERLYWIFMIAGTLMIIGSMFKGAAGPLGMIGTALYNVLLTLFTIGLYPIGRAARWLREKVQSRAAAANNPDPLPAPLDTTPQP
jgi:hypothetical protein